MSPEADAADSEPAHVTIHRPLRRMTQRIGDPLHIGAVISTTPHTSGDDTPPMLPSVPPCTPVAEKYMPLQFASLMPLTTVKPSETAAQASSISPTAQQRSPTLKHCSYNLQDHKHHMQAAALHDDLAPKMDRGKVGEMWAGRRDKIDSNEAGEEEGGGGGGGGNAKEGQHIRWKGYGYSSGRGTPVFMS